MSDADAKQERAREQPAPAGAAAVAAAVAAAGELFDCWNRIGVEGDGSCRELEKFIHCRNCPVYSEAGLLLLERGLPPEYREGWTEQFARKKVSPAGGKTSVVIFRVGPEWLALPTPVFQEIVENRPVHSIPHRRKGIVLGLVNVRGELLLCVSLGRLLGLEQGGSAGPPGFVYSRLPVVAWDARRLVFPTDEIHGIHRFQPEELAGPQATIAASALTCTQTIFRWQGRLVGLLEPELLFATLNRSLS